MKSMFVLPIVLLMTGITVVACTNRGEACRSVLTCPGGGSANDQGVCPSGQQAQTYQNPSCDD
jgi:hypothetical protein